MALLFSFLHGAYSARHAFARLIPFPDEEIGSWLGTSTVCFWYMADACQLEVYDIITPCRSSIHEVLSVKIDYADDGTFHPTTFVLRAHLKHLPADPPFVFVRRPVKWTDRFNQTITFELTGPAGSFNAAGSDRLSSCK